MNSCEKNNQGGQKKIKSFKWLLKRKRSLFKFQPEKGLKRNGILD
jgi:hypothetical protein